ncbi:hypothetical protein K474DRAFT_485043 [Panus rudis PR-1116 ss-1]|nr:hypothetical protein K474DRAFT_1714119 [Panus rudis PR-1116 ss-1]KAI0071908.1 hypothetical protein K474DRAFT_485043 [Panus rudis PR-1116 ss-1]
MHTTRDMTVRNVLEAPSSTDVAFYGTIYIFHPGDDSLLLSLPAYDSFQGRGGISHRLVREACSILANNNDGFLTADREGNQLVPNDDAILAAGEYYYRCNLADPLYPVVTDFAAWTFPREIPASWTSRSTQERAQRLHFARSRSAMSDTVKSLDGGCIVTKYVTHIGCENAHLVPRNESDWFDRNRMLTHSINPQAGIDDVANGVTLRNDVYAVLDANGFVFYPPAPGGKEYVAYVVKELPVYVNLFHQHLVDMHPRVSEQFLYARFAYAMINGRSRIPNLPNTPPQGASTVQQTTRKSGRKASASSFSLHSIHEDDKHNVTHDVPMDTGTIEQVEADRFITAQSPLHIGASSSKQTMSEEEEFSVFEQDWQERFAKRFPWIMDLPEVEDPPDIEVSGAHAEIPRILRLRKKYFENNPQIRQVVGPTASERDMALWREDEDDIENPHQHRTSTAKLEHENAA